VTMGEEPKGVALNFLAGAADLLRIAKHAAESAGQDPATADRTSRDSNLIAIVLQRQSRVDW